VAIDREKVLDAAQKFVEKKKYDKAVLELRKIIQADPNDARTRLKIGDLESKQERYADAVSTYEEVGKQYASQGFALKAIAVYKQIREIIAKHVPQLESQYAHITPKLAELYQQLGLTSDALAALDEVATRLQRQQRDGEAIEVFKKIVELDPTNPLPHLRLAEALSRIQNVDAAVDEFAIAASQLLKLGRRDDALKVLERLLHHKADLAQARIAAELYLSRGQQADGMQALAKLQLCFQANPKDLDTLSLLARAFNVIGQAAKAVEVQKEMCRIARDTGKNDVLAPLLQQLLRLVPSDEGVRKMAIAAGLLGEAPPPQAPPPPPAQSLAPAYQQQQPQYGQQQQYAQQQQQQQYAQQQQYGRAMPPPAMQPTAMQQAAMQQQMQQPGPVFHPPQQSETSYEPVDAHDLIQEGSGVDLDAQQYLESVPPEEEVVRAQQPGHAQQGSQNAYRRPLASEGQLEVVEQDAPELAPDMSEQLAQVLADAGSFRRVRLYAKAIATLKQGLELEPRSLDVREALRDVYLEAGRSKDAVDEMLAMASLFIDALDGEGAARMLQDVLTVDPGNRRAVDMLRELGYEYVDENGETAGGYEPDTGQEAQRYSYPPGTAGASTEAPLPSYDLEEMGPEDVSNEYSDPRIIMSAQMQAARARGAGDEFQSAPPSEDDAEPLPSFPLDAPEADASEPFDLVQPPPDTAGETELDGQAYAAGTDEVARYEEPRFEEPRFEEPRFEEPEPAPAKTAPPAATGADLEEALEEADFFASRGLYEDARNTINDQLQLHPNNRLLKEKLAELDQQEQSAKRGSGTRERPLEEDVKTGVDRSFDIAASLDAVEDSQVPAFEQADKQVDVEEVFAKFKEGVAKQISLDDGQSHYDLGVAYKEMGLTDDALREFDTAARDPKRECICRSMIGTIQMDRGNVNEAIDAFMRGLHAQSKSPEQETMLCFEIGAAYELKKMNREALSYFQKVMRREPNYRDVQERVRRLSTVSKAPPRQAAVGADDEFDRAFDDLIEKS
jgi:pilus assembly protein FimV